MHRLGHIRAGRDNSGCTVKELREIAIFPGNFTQNLDFSRQIFEKFKFFSGKFLKNLNFFRQFNFFLDFPGKNCSFTASSGQIVQFLFKSHHFRTYFLYMIRYNNISPPDYDPLPIIWWL